VNYLLMNSLEARQSMSKNKDVDK